MYIYIYVQVIHVCINMYKYIYIYINIYIYAYSHNTFYMNQLPRLNLMIECLPGACFPSSSHPLSDRLREGSAFRFVAENDPHFTMMLDILG